ncbi:MAG: FAD-dependent oxidoreductase, partial [Caldimonas sp.]
MATRAADVIVVGLGVAGSAVLRHLARQGASVVGIDRLRPPHDRGSSHGHSRITRLAIGEGHEYVPLVQRSHALWRELEAETGASLMQTTGGLVIATPESQAATFHGRPGFFERTVGAAERF